MRSRLFAAALLVFFAGSKAAEAAPVRYTIDAKDSLFAVVTKKDTHTIFSGAAHDHAIHASEIAGAITWDPAEPAACKIEITVPVAGLRADDVTIRKRVGLPPGEILPKNREDV